MSDWAARNVFWHVYPLGFTSAEKVARAEGAVVHRLPKLIMWLDYAVDLGASGLLLGPIFQSSSHGYDTTDYYVIDPRLGDDADFDALIAAAHRRGLRVVLDGVFNHVGRDFPAFQRAIAQGPTSPDAGLFRIAFDQRSADGTPSYGNFEGHEQLPALNHNNPAVADLIVEVMKHWLARGADGWRLDAAYAVPRPFWARVLPRVRADFPDAYIFGEVIHGDYVDFVRESTVDSVTEYELWKAIWSVSTRPRPRIRCVCLIATVLWAGLRRDDMWTACFPRLTPGLRGGLVAFEERGHADRRPTSRSTEEGGGVVFRRGYRGRTRRRRSRSRAAEGQA